MAFLLLFSHHFSLHCVIFWTTEVSQGIHPCWDGQGDPGRSHFSSLWFSQAISFSFFVVHQVFYISEGEHKHWHFFGRFCAPQEHPGDAQQNIHGVAKALECPAGHYCPPGTRVAHQHPCPEGTYSHQPGLANPRDCRPCPGGTFCARAGGNCLWLNEILVCFGAGREGSVLCGSSKCHRAFAGISGIPWADFKGFFASHLLKLN